MSCWQNVPKEVYQKPVNGFTRPRHRPLDEATKQRVSFLSQPRTAYELVRCYGMFGDKTVFSMVNVNEMPDEQINTLVNLLSERANMFRNAGAEKLRLAQEAHDAEVAEKEARAKYFEDAVVEMQTIQEAITNKSATDDQRARLQTLTEEKQRYDNQLLMDTYRTSFRENDKQSTSADVLTQLERQKYDRAGFIDEFVTKLQTCLTVQEDADEANETVEEAVNVATA